MSTDTVLVALLAGPREAGAFDYFIGAGGVEALLDMGTHETCVCVREGGR